MGNFKKFLPVRVWKFEDHLTAFEYKNKINIKDGFHESQRFDNIGELFAIHKRLFPEKAHIQYSETEYMATKLFYEIWKALNGDWKLIQGYFWGQCVESKNIIQGPFEKMFIWKVFYKQPYKNKLQEMWCGGYNEDDAKKLFHFRRENKQQIYRKIKKLYKMPVFRVSEFEFINHIVRL